jgi:hypothetical protein
LLLAAGYKEARHPLTLVVLLRGQKRSLGSFPERPCIARTYYGHGGSGFEIQLQISPIGSLLPIAALERRESAQSRTVRRVMTHRARRRSFPTVRDTAKGRLMRLFYGITVLSLGANWHQPRANLLTSFG